MRVSARQKLASDTVGAGSRSGPRGESPRCFDELPSSSTADDPLAAGRRHLGSHYDALARGAPDPRHARAAVTALRRAARGGDPDGRARALLAEAAVAACAGAGFLVRAQMVVLARRAARAALQCDPDRSEAHAALGLLSLHAPTSRVDRAMRARAHLGHAVRLEPGRPDWRAWLARACRETGDEKAARREIETLRGTLPPPAANALLASVLGAASPPEAAAEAPVARTAEPSGRWTNTGAHAAIEVRAARRGYPDREVLRGVDLDVHPGEIVALVGENGAGKSTLLGAISGRVALETGHVNVLGHPVTAGRPPRGLGHAPQSVGLYPLLTVREHLASFARLHGLRGRSLRLATEAALEWCGLEDRAGELTRTLSGGMRRRLAIGLAAVHDPAVLLLDEPMTGIDSIHRERIWLMLRDRTRRGTALLCAAPHADDVSPWTDRILELVDGEIARAPVAPAGRVPAPEAASPPRPKGPADAPEPREESGRTRRSRRGDP
jgi:ABC-2 type transport system ATP-binding protein